jgi:hypothetical protein
MACIVQIEFRQAKTRPHVTGDVDQQPPNTGKKLTLPSARKQTSILLMKRR